MKTYHEFRRGLSKAQRDAVSQATATLAASAIFQSRYQHNTGLARDYAARARALIDAFTERVTIEELVRREMANSDAQIDREITRERRERRAKRNRA